MMGLNAVVTDLKEQNNRETTVQKLLAENSFLKAGLKLLVMTVI